ncbi:helix-turn-helix domain-containing protein [Yinghuangia sp. ASG 101]|uniref:helix-turn-helix domain-containing protein n=1 Tax=Yinghuangia sp. ASG 101 TaxID=2896848 RepID=UPI001E431E5B|nr:helix-turn-helix transcriptional regulator [Yinghuangia sp. ASG 101]UGQ14814.1 helix-turn-helix domain-containing protein [Yinghuangia sp. ASG 101]
MAVEPTYARRELGAALKRLRERAKLTQVRVADTCKWSQAKVVRMEAGNVALTPHDLDLLAEQYGASAEERKQLVLMMDRTEEGQWWQPFNVTTSMDEFLSHESRAIRIRTSNFGCWPGLLQSHAYAQAIFAGSPHVPDPDEAEAVIDLRMRRARILESGVELQAVVSEALLVSPIGGTDVHRRQLSHVLELTERPSITVQAVPLSNETVVTVGGLIIFEFGAQTTSVAYGEHAVGLSSYQDRLTVRRYSREFEHLKAHAWSHEETRAQLKTRISNL